MTTPQVKTHLEMQEEMNQKMIKAEEEKWNRDQLHMESQILNTIDLAREKKRIIEKDEKKMKAFAEKKAKMEKDRVGRELKQS